MPGNRASAANGQAQQIWRARKITAFAPPILQPSAVKTRISSRGAPGSRPSRCMTQSVCSGRKTKPRRRNIRSKRFAEAVQDGQSPSYKIQPRNESARGAAASLRARFLPVGLPGRRVGSTEVAARRPSWSRDRPSLMSVFSVNSEFMSQKFCHRFAIPSKRKGLPPIFASLSKAAVGSFSSCK
jgi:hypothetical protein